MNAEKKMIKPYVYDKYLSIFVTIIDNQIDTKTILDEFYQEEEESYHISDDLGTSQ